MVGLLLVEMYTQFSPSHTTIIKDKGNTAAYATPIDRVLKEMQHFFFMVLPRG